MKKFGPVPKYHIPGKDSQNYLSNPAILSNISDFLVKGDKALRIIGALRNPLNLA
jgi:hypothetical protein